MEDWIKKELEKHGVYRIIPTKPRSFDEIRKSIEDEGNVAIPIGTIKAAIMHDRQNVESLTAIVKSNWEEWGKAEGIKKELPSLFEYVDQLHAIANVIANRNTTHGRMLEQYVYGESDTEEG